MGLVCVEAQRSTLGGVKYEDIVYPDELLRDLGGGLYQLATALDLPSDGDMTHNASSLLPVISVSQIEWTATYASFDRARRRISWDSLWERGGSTANMFKNFILALVLASSLFTAFAGFRTSGSASELAHQVGDTRSALNRTIELLQEQRATVPTPQPSAAPRVVPTLAPKP